jgi:hypothetical protein
MFRNVSGSRNDEGVVALRSRRLESLFGAPFDRLTPSHVRGLVDAGAQEAFDLDFKLTAYGRGDSDRRALAGDVAAMANTAGGIIVIGIDEDEQARATAAPGVEVTETETRRVLQVVGALVSPLPVFDVVTVLDEPLAIVEPRPIAPRRPANELRCRASFSLPSHVVLTRLMLSSSMRR